MIKSRAWFGFLVGATITLVSTSHAAQILSATVSAPQARLWSQEGGKMVPVQSAPQGTRLQISDQSRGGWRQVVIREAGKPARWGWIAEREITVAGAATATPPVAAAAPQTPGVARAAEARADTPDRAPDTKKNESVTLGLKSGIALSLGTTATVSYLPALDIGFRLFGTRGGALFLELHSLATWASGSLDLSGTAYPFFSLSLIELIYLTGRNLFHSGLYTGAGAGSLLSLSSIPSSNGAEIINTTTFAPRFAFGAVIGYDIRPWPIFSFGPEIHYIGALVSTATIDAATGNATTILGLSSLFAFLGTLRFHF